LGRQRARSLPRAWHHGLAAEGFDPQCPAPSNFAPAARILDLKARAPAPFSKSVNNKRRCTVRSARCNGHCFRRSTGAALIADWRAKADARVAKAANVLAVAIPCHRILCNDGSLSGYRWGVARKRTLLERETAK